VYATCSLLAEENEAVADAFSAEEPTFVRLDAHTCLALGIGDSHAAVTEAGNLRLWPHLHATDGFFASVWQKLPN
jgi:16S rRNA (cytosine967-C5)-methyltransferase